MGSKIGKAMHREACASALYEALLEFGFTKARAAEVSCSNFMGRETSRPFKFGRLEINKGAIERAVRK